MSSTSWNCSNGEKSPAVSVASHILEGARRGRQARLRKTVVLADCGGMMIQGLGIYTSDSNCGSIGAVLGFH